MTLNPLCLSCYCINKGYLRHQRNWKTQPISSKGSKIQIGCPDVRQPFEDAVFSHVLPRVQNPKMHPFAPIQKQPFIVSTVRWLGILGLVCDTTDRSFYYGELMSDREKSP